MGLIRTLFAPRPAAAIGGAVREVAEVFTPSATRRMELSAEAQQAALAQHGAEFTHAPAHWFDSVIDGLNRLPRPMLALGTLGLFVHAMAEPEDFARRMHGLHHIPEPLWWLLGAIVAFYFGARETHYFRVRPPLPPALPGEAEGPAAGAAPLPAETTGANPALDAWRHRGGER